MKLGIQCFQSHFYNLENRICKNHESNNATIDFLIKAHIIMILPDTDYHIGRSLEDPVVGRIVQMAFAALGDPVAGAITNLQHTL